MNARTLIAAICAMGIAAGTAAAQDVAKDAGSQDREEVALRAVPVEASTVSTLLRSAENQLQADHLILNDAAASQAVSVVGLDDPLATHQGVSVTGGLDHAMSRSLADSGGRLEPIHNTGSSQRIGMKTVVLRLIGGTAVAGALVGLGALVFRHTMRGAGGG